MLITFKHAKLIQEHDLGDHIVQSFKVNDDDYGIMLYNKVSGNRNFAYFDTSEDMFAYYNLILCDYYNLILCDYDK